MGLLTAQLLLCADLLPSILSLVLLIAKVQSNARYLALGPGPRGHGQPRSD